MFTKPNVVISKCIEHEHCRYDGSMITSEFVAELKDYVNFLPLCPEMAIGLPSPMESLRLVLANDEIKLLSYINGTDMTAAMEEYSRRISKDILEFQPDGFILKSRSPSCGIKDVKVYADIGKAPPLNRKSPGIFGRDMLVFFNDFLIEDEGRLLNFTIREHFYTVIFTLADFRRVRGTNSIKSLIDFHSRNKYLLMAYSQAGLKKLGRIVAGHGKVPPGEVFSEYEKKLREVMMRKPSCGQYINVMLHLFGYFKKDISEKEKAYFIDMLELYRSQRIPQSSIMSVLSAWGARFDRQYLNEQTIFNSFPRELVTVADSGKAR
ncbi:MAG: DUF1722 domain-containing protein [Clostridia bacterium]